MTPWWRRNRWGLLTLPVAAALVVGANAHRLEDYWWDRDLRDAAATGSTGAWVQWSTPFADAAGPGSRSVRVQVRGVSRTEQSAETAWWHVDLGFAADPNQVLVGCHLALVDDAGNRYVHRAGLTDDTETVQACVPDDRPGPAPALAKTQSRSAAPGQERPPQWSTSPVVVTPPQVTITQVWLWWEAPEYLAVSVR